MMKNRLETFGMKYLKIAVTAVKEAVFPARCLTCRSLFRVQAQGGEAFYPSDTAQVFKRLIAPFLCATCSSGFLPITSPICPCCGNMFKSRQGEDHRCGECMTSPKRFGIARSTGIMEKGLMNAIHCFKYREKIQMARPLGTMLLSSFVGCWDVTCIDAIVPVPLHRRKLKTRGFNQSLLMVKNWQRVAARLAVDLPSIPILGDVLVKIKWTEPQTGLARKKRIKNVKNSFAVSDPSRLEGKRILLVDDVYTTGATADECTKVLLQGGAIQVDVLTLARAM